MHFSREVQVLVECVGAVLLAVFFWLAPQRNRNRLIDGVYRRIRPLLVRVGLAHAPWTMFASGPNRNHFFLLRLQTRGQSDSVELRDVWRLKGWWGDLVDERPRRILVAMIRSDTGPNTKRNLAEGFVRWYFSERMVAPDAGCEGTAVFGQEVFRSPLRRKADQSEVEVLVKYTLAFKVGTDGRVEFAA